MRKIEATDRSVRAYIAHLRLVTGVTFVRSFYREVHEASRKNASAYEPTSDLGSHKHDNQSGECQVVAHRIIRQKIEEGRKRIR